jgi:hypothetical protein
MAETSDTTRHVLREIGEERVHQVHDRGWTPAHDDTHTTQEWAWLLSRRTVELSCPWPDAVLDPRRQLVEVAAIAAAAIESYDRLNPDQATQPVRPI